MTLGAIALMRTKSNQPAPEGYIGALAVFFPFLSFIATVVLAVDRPGDMVYKETLGNWIAIGDFKIAFGFLFDSLTQIMLLFVTGITTLIVLYSVGYMKSDSGFTRFLSYLNLFLFSMIVLVLADSLPLTFLGWEGVGLCSYLLVGFWNRELPNCKAANKAFLVNRVGDVGFLLGMFALIAFGGTALLNYENLEDFLEGQNTIHGIFLLAAFFLFFACTAKSAQIPLLTWLPDAMAGPTPVSALIHAATMVTAGVYLMARLSPLFLSVPEMLVLVLLIALGTALWAAITGLLQHDIKKVLAYSTVSQLGFMFMAAGVGAYDVAIFHVFTHAFTKAALFLGAGSVIHALDGEQDIRKMGGLASKLPSTFFIMLIAWASLIGLPGLACFWSKDLILEKLHAVPFAYYIALFTALLTAIYMTRLMVLVFFGKFRGDQHTADHIHESPFVMQLPMWILAIGCIFAGFAPLTSGHSELFFVISGTAASLLGLGFAWIYFRKRIPRYTGNDELVGFAKKWTLLFDYLHFVLGILPTRVSVFVLDMVQRFLRITMIILGAIPQICAEGLRFMQASKLRVQLTLTVISSVILIYWLVFFVR